MKVHIHSFGFEDRVKSEFITKEYLGGKGYGLINMSNDCLPVPMGLVIPTSICMPFLAGEIAIEDILASVMPKLLKIEGKLGYMPLLSVRSGAALSMPGMCDTILNVGMNKANIPEWEERIGVESAWDSYHRLYQMITTTVKGIKMEELDYMLETYGYTPKEFSIESLARKLEYWDKAFTLNSHVAISSMNLIEQLRLTIAAVFKSWSNERAAIYRDVHNYPHDSGTAVVIQMMVFGNKNNSSCTGVLFSRNALTGHNAIQGEFLVNAQGEDIVAGTHTPQNIWEMADWNDQCLDELVAIAEKLEEKYKTVQDIEFTIEDGKVYILQCRSAKMSAMAQYKVWVDKYHDGKLNKEDVLNALTLEGNKAIHRKGVHSSYTEPCSFCGTPASNGVATGLVSFTSTKACENKKNSIPTVLLREDTTPEDILGMIASEGIVTKNGGLTAHAAVVARGLNKPCIVGCNQLQREGSLWKVGCIEVTENDCITIDGYTGKAWLNKVVPLHDASNNRSVSLIQSWIGRVNMVHDINAITEGCYLQMPQFDSRDEAIAYIESLPVGVRYYVGMCSKELQGADLDLSALFGESHELKDFQVLALMLAKGGHIKHKVTLVVKEEAYHTHNKVMTRLEEKGFKVVRVLDTLLSLATAKEGRHMVSGELQQGVTKELAKAITELLQRSSKGLEIIPNARTTYRIFHDYITQR